MLCYEFLLIFDYDLPIFFFFYTEDLNIFFNEPFFYSIESLDCYRCTPKVTLIFEKIFSKSSDISRPLYIFYDSFFL